MIILTTQAKAQAKTSETFIVLASLTIVTYNLKNMFIVQATGDNLIKLFWHKFTQVIFKLDLIIVIPQISLMFIKWSGEQKSLSKFAPKQIYEIDP